MFFQISNVLNLKSCFSKWSKNFPWTHSSQAGLYLEFVNNSYSFHPHHFFLYFHRYPYCFVFFFNFSFTLLILLILSHCLISLPPFPSSLPFSLIPFLPHTHPQAFFCSPLSKPQHTQKPEPDFKKFLPPIQCYLTGKRKLLMNK